MEATVTADQRLLDGAEVARFLQTMGEGARAGGMLGLDSK